MMNITIEQVQGQLPITIMSLAGELDASCYLDVIEAGKKLRRSGTHYLLLDMSQMPFMASSGLVALHHIASLMRGEGSPDPQAGWTGMQAPSENSIAHEANCKLLNPAEQVRKTLEITGFSHLFEIFYNREEAIASFGAST